MDRQEAMLRELNLYPQWTLRDAPQPLEIVVVASVEMPVEQMAVVPEVEVLHAAPVDEMIAETEVAAAPVTAFIPAKTWPELKQQVRDCERCGLRAGCTQTVFGVGNERADWFFVGEGPGVDEDEQGEPFVGESGKLLDNMLAAIKLQRGKDVYIANVSKCRPPENSHPTAEQIALCLPYLARQIELVNPKLIVALGKVAATNLLGEDMPLDALRGTLHDYNGIPLIVTYHPAYLLRRPSAKAQAWQDLCFAVDVMKEVQS